MTGRPIADLVDRRWAAFFVQCASVSGSLQVRCRSSAHELLLSYPSLSSSQTEMSPMLMHWLLAAVHLLAFAGAFAAVLARGSAFRRLAAGQGAPRVVLLADNIWGLAALVLLVTGLLRAFGGYEKGTDYYLHQPLFHLKMALFIAILLLEVRPMIALIKWRIALGRSGAIETGQAVWFARVSHLQALLVVLLVVAASRMARGVTWAQL